MSAAEASMSGGQGKSRRPLSRGKKFWEEWLAQCLTPQQAVVSPPPAPRSAPPQGIGADGFYTEEFELQAMERRESTRHHRRPTVHRYRPRGWVR